MLSEQGSSFPFAKWTCYEVGLASGMVARWPGKVKAGSSNRALVEYCDVTPTLLDVVGLKTPDTMDGQSFLNVLNGKNESNRRYTYGLHTTRGIINGTDYFGIRSCGTKKHRYIRNLHHESTFSNAVTRTKSEEGVWPSWVAKAKEGDAAAKRATTRYQHRPAEELYDVENDPHCLNNLIDDASVANVRDELSAELARWMKSQNDTGHDIEAAADTRQRVGRDNQKKQQKQN